MGKKVVHINKLAAKFNRMWKDNIKAEIKDILINSPVIYKYLGNPEIALKILQESKLQLSSPKILMIPSIAMKN